MILFFFFLGLQIYGGNVVNDISSFPFMAQLILNDTLHSGAVIIGANKVITTCHSFPEDPYLNATTIKVRAGSLDPNDGGVIRNVSRFQLHPQFEKPYLNDNDIAVMILDQPFDLSTPYIKKIAMAEPGKSNYIYENMSSEFLLAGYGGTESTDKATKLRWLQEPNVNWTECAKIYDNIYDRAAKQYYHVTENMFCSGNELLKFVREMDSGGK